MSNLAFTTLDASEGPRVQPDDARGELWCGNCENVVPTIWCVFCEDLEKGCVHRFCETEEDHRQHRREGLYFDQLCPECWRLKELARMRGHAAAQQGSIRAEMSLD